MNHESDQLRHQPGDRSISCRSPIAISIIIPALNECRTLPDTLASIPDMGEVEVIIVDGGSSDGTPGMAGGRGRVIRDGPGRGRQMNAGSAAARGEALLFLHADTTLPPDAIPAIRSALLHPDVVGGAFRLRIATHRRILRFVAWGVNLRSVVIGMPYGDQAIFVRRAVFSRLGGFADWDIMEDIDLVRRMRRHGRMATLDTAVTTSARRWVANGVLRTTATNWVAILLYFFGVGAARIRRVYDRMLVKEGAAIVDDHA